MTPWRGSNRSSVACSPDVSVSVNGVDMTERFRPAPADWLGRESEALLGLVDGLVVGENTVVVEHAGTPLSSMTVTNYPVTGPIFSGEHLEPYLCLEDLGLDREGQPRRFAIGNGDFLVGVRAGRRLLAADTCRLFVSHDG